VKFTPLLVRILFGLTIATALLGGMGAGLARLGWGMDSLSKGWMLVHGPLMICGFLGTLICLERGVALASRVPLSLAVPAINAVGALALLLWPDSIAAKVLLTAGSAGLVLLFAYMFRLHPSRDVAIMAAGAVSWLIGNILWLGGQPVHMVVHWWSAFLILTIVGERLELSRVRRLTRSQQTLLVLTVGVFLAGVALTQVQLVLGVRVLGAGAILMAAWLLRFDIARRTIRQTGLPRYIAACLLLGYVWLGVGGAIAIWKGLLIAGPDYEMVLHAFLLGFVFSMIFGHMPIILPALTGLQVTFHPLFYGHLALLHLTLAYRIYGNLVLDQTARRWGGMLNVAAVLLFLLVTAVTVMRANAAKPQSSQAAAHSV
jgi:hypothetical protein